ncbi:MAG: ABC transporter permease [Sandaracinaceae bacterium]|nr:ABC transporter permease [Sandaracinaceae bacterium]
MIELVIKRVSAGLLIVLAATTFIFFLANGIGDPALATLGPNASAESLEDFRRTHGLDQPPLVQFGRYLGAAVQGDLGRSFRDNQPVATVIWDRLPRTVLLMGMAMGFELLFGLTLGILAALRRNTWFDTGFMGMAFLGISVPNFVSGPIFLLVFAFLLGWFPIGGYGVDFGDHVWHALLPALTMAIIGSSTFARIMRSEMIDTLGADYVRTARAKGLHPARVVLGHAARNALLPIVTLLGLRLPFLVAGAIITEHIFAWPGMGRLVIESITSLDVPVIMGVVVITAVSVQFGNGLADVAVGALDPRVRHARS